LELWRKIFQPRRERIEFEEASLPAKSNNFAPRRLSMLVLKLRSSHFFLILLILSSSIFFFLSVNLIFAQNLKRNDLNDAEKLIWEKVSAGEVADLAEASGNKRQIRAKFLENLLTGGYNDFKVHRYGVTIWNATIIGSLDLRNADIPCDVELRQCDFQENVNFSKSRFKKDLSLINCQFDGKAYFSRMDVEKGVYIWGGKSRFKQDVKFDRITIGESINMESTTFEGEADFSEMRIKGDAYFGERVKFLGHPVFARAAVGGLLDFGREGEGAKFSNDKEFSREKELDFSGLKVGSHLALRSAEILRPAKFNGATIGGDFKAQKANFSDEVSFQMMKVGRAMHLTGASFAGPLNFSEAEIGGYFNASYAKILYGGPANFQKLRVAQGVFFKDVKLIGSVDFTHANIGGPLLFEWSEKEDADTIGQSSREINKPNLLEGEQTFFLKEASFRELIIRGPIKDEAGLQEDEDKKSKNLENLRNEKPNGVIDLEKTTIERRFILEGIAIQAFKAPELQVKGLAAFDRVRITDKVDLQKSNFQSLEINQVIWPGKKPEINISRMVFQDLSSLGYVKDFLDLLNKSSFDKKSYQQLEDYLERHNQKKLADEIFRNERQRELEVNYAPIKWYDHWKTPVKWFLNLSGWLTGYGRSNNRILELTLLIIFFGTLWFNPSYLQSGRAFPKLENRKLLRLLLSLDFFLPNVPQKVTDLTNFPRIELGLENFWQPPPNSKLLNAYVWVHQAAGYLLFVMLFPVAFQFIKKFIGG
jgi:hypothetical protein